ncbi:MAG: hypothetical protein ACFE8B_06290 [Candidatus Hermodarchaeota archaeon]
MVRCIYCKNEIPPGVSSCPYCLDESKPKEVSTSKSGVVLGILGGTLSILIGVLLLVLYPEFQIFGSLFLTIFQTVLILGGILAISGSILHLLAKNLMIAKQAWIFVLLGAILGGGNVFSIFAAVKLKKS